MTLMRLLDFLDTRYRLAIYKLKFKVLAKVSQFQTANKIVVNGLVYFQALAIIPVPVLFFTFTSRQFKTNATGNINK